MKRIVPFIFILTILLSGCGSSKKQLEKGNYDAAIQKAVKQLRKDKSMPNRSIFSIRHIKFQMNRIMKESVS